MKTIDQLNSKLFQTSVKEIDPNRIKVIVQQNKFSAGTVNISERTFISAPRSPKNLFRLFGDGIGLDAEILNVILPFYAIEKILIPYQDTVLETTPDKWRKLGIISPYCDQRVNKQIILALKKITLEDSKNYQPMKPQSQLSLFEVA